MRIGESLIKDYWKQRDLDQPGEVFLPYAHFVKGDRFEILLDYDIGNGMGSYYTVRLLKNNLITCMRKEYTKIIDKNEELEIKLW